MRGCAGGAYIIDYGKPGPGCQLAGLQSRLGAAQKNRIQPHETDLRLPESTPLHGDVEADPQAVPGPRRAWLGRLPLPRRTSGAPKGQANGAFRHGLYTAKAAEERRRLRELLDHVREMVAGIS